MKTKKSVSKCTICHTCIFQRFYMLFSHSLQLKFFWLTTWTWRCQRNMFNSYIWAQTHNLWVKRQTIWPSRWLHFFLPLFRHSHKITRNVPALFDLCHKIKSFQHRRADQCNPPPPLRVGAQKCKLLKN